ncbi:DUF6798 domain-containing protein [uncultured Roseibium sp.]|uniref:DUF6798 domain-containing protein n=1 Tax=uncultured Roseibium sp. TaxID=1936171 RepID=UPI00261425DC|nr:DUF6798 domain-containing protein [uncultured Roseibium sp.]
MSGARDARLKLLSLALAVVAAFVLFSRFGETAAIWPATDNLPAACRLLDPACLLGDFFTDASASINPRNPIAYVLTAMSKASNSGALGGLAVMNTLILVLLPIVSTVFIWAAIKTHLSSGTNTRADRLRETLAVVLAPLLFVALAGGVGDAFLIAGWHPVRLIATAQDFSLMLCLAGVLLIWKRRVIAGPVLIFVAGIFHPVMALYTVVFSTIVLSRWKIAQDVRYCAGLLAALAAAVFVKMTFAVSAPIDTQTFVDIYVRERHPHHYLPSQYGASGNADWAVSFALLIAALVIVAVLLVRMKNHAWRNTVLAILSYAGAIAAQYALVELYPIKTVVALGPARYSMFGLWFLMIFGAVALIETAMRELHRKKIEDKAFGIADQLFRRAGPLSWAVVSVPFVLLAIAAAYNVSVSSHFDSDIDGFDEVIAFAKTETGEDDVFVLPAGSLGIEFRLSADRAIFVGKAFPFSEDYFLEWMDRFASVYGTTSTLATYPGQMIWARQESFYRSHTPASFARFADQGKIDWVVVEKDFSAKFELCAPSFENESYLLYAIEALKTCRADQRAGN